MNITIAPNTASMANIVSTATDETASRALDATIYQATAGARLCIVTATVTAANAYLYVQIGTTSPPLIAANYPNSGTVANGRMCTTFWVPANWYYRITGVNTTLVSWVEISGA